MNFTKAISSVAFSAVTSCVVGLVAAAIGIATSFTVGTALVFGAVVGVILTALNMAQPQGMMGNALVGGALFWVGTWLTTAAAALTLPVAAPAIVTGLVVGFVYSAVTEGIEG